jgi:hypothetical protein
VRVVDRTDARKTRTSPGETTGEILIEKAVDLVNRSPAPDH